MSGEADVIVLESKASPEQQAAAKVDGWQGPDKYKGDPEKFIDADTYLERAETVLPIVKSKLDQARRSLAQSNERVSAVEAALRASNERLATIEERHSVDTAKAIELAKKQVKEELKQAVKDGDHDAVAELTEQMVELNKEEKAAPAKTEEKPPFEEVKPTEEQLAWQAENTWFSVNEPRTAAFLACANNLQRERRREGLPILVGRPLFEAAKAEMEKEFGAAKPAPVDRVSGGRNGSDQDTRQSGGGKKDYASLPADAKAQCDADGKRFIGEGKMYKDVAAQRVGWAAVYYSQE